MGYPVIYNRYPFLWNAGPLYHEGFQIFRYDHHLRVATPELIGQTAASLFPKVVLAMYRCHDRSARKARGHRSVNDSIKFVRMDYCNSLFFKQPEEPSDPREV